MYQQYDKAVQTVLDYLVEQGFSQTPCEDFRRASREFRRYLQAESLEFSLRWLRRGLTLSNQVFQSGSLYPSAGLLPWQTMQRGMGPSQTDGFLIFSKSSQVFFSVFLRLLSTGCPQQYPSRPAHRRARSDPHPLARLSLVALARPAWKAYLQV